MSTLLFNSENSAVKAVRSVKDLLMGYEGNQGLRDFIIKNYPDIQRQTFNLDNLIKEAIAIDKSGPKIKNISDVININLKKINKTAEEAKNKLPYNKVNDKIEQDLDGLKRNLETFGKMISDVKAKPNEEPLPAGLTPEIIKESVSDTVSKYKDILDRYKKALSIMEETNDGGGGPGIHDGQGGMGDWFSNTWNTIKKPFTKEQPIFTQPKPTYDLRGMKVTDDDLNEIGNIMYGEISNRIPERQEFEMKHILNTAINRSQSPIKDPKYGNLQDRNKTILEIMQRPGQYQSYAPSGIIDEHGKTIKSQYQLLKEGNLNTLDAKKIKRIRDYLDKIKTDGIVDTTGGKMFYVHASDGTLWLGETSKEAKENANNYEKSLRKPQTSFNTSVGFPSQLTTLGK